MEEAFEAAAEGAVYVVNPTFREYFERSGAWDGHNLGVTFRAIIRRAGLTPWPRPFHNLRSSRETELAETFPMHVITAWIGNTPEIARKHYLQVTDQHFAQALQALQNPVQYPAEMACTALQAQTQNHGFARVYDALPPSANTPACQSTTL